MSENTSHPPSRPVLGTLWVALGVRWVAYMVARTVHVDQDRGPDSFHHRPWSLPPGMPGAWQKTLI